MLDVSLMGSIDRDIHWTEAASCGGGAGPGRLALHWSPFNDEHLIEVLVTGFQLPAPQTNLPGEFHVQDPSTGDDLVVLGECRIDITDAQPESPSGNTGYVYRGTGECTPTATLSVSSFSFMGFGADPQ
jgi:hypothetical protein